MTTMYGKSRDESLFALSYLFILLKVSMAETENTLVINSTLLLMKYSFIIKQTVCGSGGNCFINNNMAHTVFLISTVCNM